MNVAAKRSRAAIASAFRPGVSGSTVSAGGWPKPTRKRVTPHHRNQFQETSRPARKRPHEMTREKLAGAGRAEERVGDVPSVELPERDEVQGRDEEADPGGEADRVEEHVVPRRQLAQDEPLHGPGDEAVAVVLRRRR